MTYFNRNYYLLIATSTAFIGIESYFFSGFLAKYATISLPTILFLSLFLQFYYFTKNSPASDKSRVWVLTILATLATALASWAYYLDYRYFDNWFFSTTHLHPNVIRILPIFLWLSLVVSLIPIIKSNSRKAIFVFPWAVLLSLFYFQYAFVEEFIIIGIEDGIVETITFLAFLAGSFILLKTALTVRLNYAFKVLILAVSLALFFIAGEEISWGQRILSLQLPQYFAVHNTQQELTIHNLKPIQNKMWYAYILIGFVGGVIPWMTKKKPESVLLNLFYIPRPLTAYFLPLFLYGVYRTFIGPIQIKTWEETIELLFAIGVFWQCFKINSQFELKKQ